MLRRVCAPSATPAWSRATALGLALALGSSALGGSARAESPGADPRQQARSLGYAGVRDYGNGHFDTASAQLERSYALLPVPSLGLWSARSLVKLGQLVEAERRYRAVAAMTVETGAPAVQHAARATAELELAELLPRLPTLRVHIRGARRATVIVTIDDVRLDDLPLDGPIERASREHPPLGALRDAEPPLELHVNPGPHRIVGVRAAARAELATLAREGSTEDLELRFPELPVSPGAGADAHAAAPASPWRTAGWAAIAVSAASLGTSSLAYYLGRREHAALEDEGVCQKELCRAGGDLDTYNALRTTHLVTLFAGAALGAVGLTVVLLDPAAEPSASSPQMARRGDTAPQIPLALTVDARSATLTGHF
jgi:hypothetical protein